MDVQTFLIGMLTGVVGLGVLFALPIIFLIVVAVVEIMLDPSVAEAPEIDYGDPDDEIKKAQEELDEKIKELEAKKAAFDAAVNKSSKGQ